MGRRPIRLVILARGNHPSHRRNLRTDIAINKNILKKNNQHILHAYITSTPIGRRPVGLYILARGQCPSHRRNLRTDTAINKNILKKNNQQSYMHI